MKGDTLQLLKRQLAGFAHGGGNAFPVVSTGIPALDRWLPDGGIRRGSLLEFLIDGPGGGTATLMFAVIARLLSSGDVCAVFDRRQSFYAPAATRLGIRPEQLIVVRPPGETETLWAVEQALRCRGVAVVVADLGNIDGVVFRRLQLAVEQSGTIGLLARPVAFRTQPAWADLRLMVRPQPFEHAGPEVLRRLEVELLHCRGRLGDGRLTLEIDDETGDVREVSQLADSARPSHMAGA